MPDTLPPPCSILLLAGGRGQRMEGRDKGLLLWRGRPLIAWLHAVVRPLTDDLIVSCNRNQALYQPYADRLVADREPDFPGPLAGVRAGLAGARHPWLLVLPCDSPLIDLPLVSALRLAGAREPTPLMLCQDGQWEPLFCMIPTHLAPRIEDAWRAGERSVCRILSRLGARSLDLPASDTRTRNFNTPAHLLDVRF